MSVDKPSNLAASVRARLKNIADRDRVDFQSVLTRYGIERFLYRLASSPYADRNILKGASLFVAWDGHPHRATRDLDLLGFGPSDVASVVERFKEIVLSPVEPDGLSFSADNIRGEPIKEGQKYRGVRLHVAATLGNARVPVQIDVGFGDQAEHEAGDFPTLLDFPAPRLRLYSRETVVAEKVHAMVALGLLNGRLKDFYDVWYLSRTGSFEGLRLSSAIALTFEARSTEMPTTVPPALTSRLLDVPGKAQMWSAFVRKSALPPSTPGLAELLVEVAAFVWPVLKACSTRQPFDYLWNPRGPWQPPISGLLG